MCGGEEVIADILVGDKKITVEEVVKLLIDRTGRAISDKSVVTASVCDANRNYHFDRLVDNHDFVVTLELWQQRFGQKPGMNAKEFLERIVALKAKIAEDRRIRNLVGPDAAPYFPIILPQIPRQKTEGNEKAEAKQPDYGRLLEQLLLPAVEASYLAAFPERQFVNYRKGELEGQVTIVEERHAKLYADLANGPIVGILFPAALHGFSPFAQRQMVNLMPQGISLAGPIEIGVGEVLYPQHLSRDNNTPVKDCSAVQWQDPSFSLHFSAYDGKLRFAYRYYLGHTDGDFSGAFFVRG
ncbi:MAG: hypothetical protein A2731_01950 [Candidatus Buchananbacteria bacterium RIFCSPHIGHO2_01_FULL_39_8]|uniref:Uncharacterized protein n=1 Tax=Candidatus Buchananbacteria bacterium RIFCSPHIGHO2_01_FULL_39_8 TaxID=1797533 RepID=A0A1G1Y0H7_9BACT|nr:MAG: hypothetical protein A2731_01950 [Candidatus Buchananbacteria bacterium RIFCSPHIGHO2_01_FULL_39_8]